MTGYAKGPFAVDWEDRYDFAALRRQRIQKAQAALTASDVDHLLVWKDENVRYLTGLRAQLIAGKTTSLNGALLGVERLQRTRVGRHYGGRNRLAWRHAILGTHRPYGVRR